MFDELQAARPRDVNLRMVVLDRSGTVDFIDVPSDVGMSHVARPGDAGQPARSVACDTLEAIVAARSGGRPVDFIKIDAEGAEDAIVCSTDWRALRPRVLLVEATLPWSSTLANQDWEPVLLGQGYVRTYFDGINCFYVPEECLPLLARHFAVPVNVLDRVTAAESVRQAADLERLAANLDQQATQIETLSAERAADRAALSRIRDEAAALRADCDVLQIALSDRDRALALVDADRARLQNEAAAAAAQIEQVQAPLSSSAAAGRPLMRRIAIGFYRIARPVVRPVAWRVRGFITRDILAQLSMLGEKVAAAPTLASAPPAPAIDAGSLAELRRLADAMERTLLTLAMERGHHHASIPAGTYMMPEMPPDPAHGDHVQLKLAGGRSVEVSCVASDMSITASLRASGGDWEPHVRHTIEGMVRPDWVCLDIGANIGAHTLSLAVLAHQGTVVAFEADPTNFALLSCNAAALERPRAAIERVHLALWDVEGTLAIGGADELSGCSFVADASAGPEVFERRLRDGGRGGVWPCTAPHAARRNPRARP